jgi:hypothetical protein
LAPQKKQGRRRSIDAHGLASPGYQIGLRHPANPIFAQAGRRTV